MEKKINVGGSLYHNIKLLVFAAFNFIYAFYMSGYLPRILYLLSMLFFISLCFLEYMYKNHFIVFTHLDTFVDEFISAMKIVCTFLIISLIIQVINHDIQGYLLSELLYVVLPPVLTFFWINTTSKTERYSYFIVLFIKNVLQFVLTNLGKININNILSINIFDSTSSVFESECAHDFLFLEIIFLFLGSTTMAIISLVLCVLCLKRISALLGIVIFLMYLLIGRTVFERIFHERRIRNIKFRVLLVFLMCIIPHVVLWVAVNGGDTYIWRKYGLDLNELTSQRLGIIQYTYNNIGHFNGCGSSHNFLMNSPIAVYRKLQQMHCDVLKIYLEDTIVGFVVYFWNILKIGSKNRTVMILLAYIVIELICTHFTYMFSAWAIFYMFAACVYDEKYIV